MGESRGLMRETRRMAGPVAAALLVSGCFYYVPASYPPAPKAHSEIRINLVEPRDIPMGEFTLNDVTIIEGVVSEATEDTIGVAARWLRPSIGRRYHAAGATFYLPRSAVASVDGWRLNPMRTVLLGAASAVGVAALMALMGSSLFGGGDGTVPPDQSSIMAPR